MEHKYNQLSIERYSTNLAKLLCDRYFATNQAINGQQLITFSPVKQINLFVIQELLLRWNHEMAHLKSPYFDFENQEVKDALVHFMNILSRKILVKRPHFEPLLRKATADTLLWVLDPAKIFEEKFLKIQDEVSGQKLQAHLKYLDIDKEYVKGFLAGLAPGILPHGNVLNQFKTYLLRNPVGPLALDHLLNELETLLPIDQLELPGRKTQAPFFKPEPGLPAEPETAPWEPEPVPQAVKPAPAPEPTPAPVVAREQPMATAPPPVMPPPPVREPEKKQPASETSLNDRLRVEKTTLNDRLARPAGTSLAENQMDKKIESLKDSISINQRFGFINELFNGENMEYYTAIKTLDAFDNADQAKDFVTQQLASRYNWSKKEEHVNKLLRLIERKFA
jgi:hypothetical protein